jgi:hypothetical protein
VYAASYNRYVEEVNEEALSLQPTRTDSVYLLVAPAHKQHFDTRQHHWCTHIVCVSREMCGVVLSHIYIGSMYAGCRLTGESNMILIHWR